MGKCIGAAVNQTCEFHTDCAQGLYCQYDWAYQGGFNLNGKENHDYENSFLNYTWPFASTCQPFVPIGFTCSEDYECGTTADPNSQYPFTLSAFCWYNTSADVPINNKMCLPYHSASDGTTFGWFSKNSTFPTEEDFKNNGRFCTSGIAFNSDKNTAQCTSSTGIFYNNAPLEAPYACDPRFPYNYCQIRFNLDGSNSNYVSVGSRGFVNATCRCSLSEDKKLTNTGYCGSVLGTDLWQEYIMQKQFVLQNTQCHSADQNNLRAQRDACGLN